MTSPNNTQGVITISGIDGVGKTTLTNKLQKMCNERGISICTIPLPRQGNPDLFVSTRDPWKIPDYVQHHYWPLWFQSVVERVKVAQKSYSIILVERGAPFSLAQMSLTPEGRRYLNGIATDEALHWIIGENYIQVTAPLKVVRQRLMNHKQSTHDSYMINPFLGAQFLKNLRSSLDFLKKWHADIGIAFHETEVSGTGEKGSEELLKVIKKIVF